MSSKRTHKARAKRTTSRRSAARPRKARRAPHAARPSAARNGGIVMARVDGVNVNDLVVMAETIKNQPAKAEFTFRASTHWLGGAHSKTKIQTFTGAGQADRSRRSAFNVEADEPQALLGSNRGPSPMEYALAGLGSSLAEGLAYNAAARGIKLDALDIELEAAMDVRGTLGVRESSKAGEGRKDLRPGFENIRVVCHLKSEAPPSELKELLEYTKATCPWMDMLQKPVPLAVELRH